MCSEPYRETCRLIAGMGRHDTIIRHIGRCSQGPCQIADGPDRLRADFCERKRRYLRRKVINIAGDSGHVMATGEATLIRRPAVAGKFYPAQPEQLRASITQAFVDAHGPGALPVVNTAARVHSMFSVMVPHAGYMYSGQGVAWGMTACAAQGRPAAVIMLGVNHRGVGAPMAVSPATGWETPLGIMPVATGLAQQVVTLAPAVQLDARAHAQEHSLEVLVPFMQFVFGVLPIVPIVIGGATVGDVATLANALAVLMQQRNVVLLVSSDFSHYISSAEAMRLDHLALAAITAIDPEGFLDTVRKYGITMCGVLPVAAALMAASQCHVQTGHLLHYQTSGDVTGDCSEVVGYGTAALYW